ncbi:hypothetical protein [Nocardia cyriacigeorgica]|uniref:nSTAND1 domain-containing NTPase n=1 Tax=Nocardia cyriacigeorgica TaxID=135487 RepID=UPI003D780CB9
MVDHILGDTATADALPLLAYLLQELYLAAGPSRRATFEHYQRLGGVASPLLRSPPPPRARPPPPPGPPRLLPCGCGNQIPRPLASTGQERWNSSRQ